MAGPRGNFYNFGYRTTYLNFYCKSYRGNAKIKKTGGPSSKPGKPAAKKPGQPATSNKKTSEPANKSGEQATKTGATAPNSQ
eukprot:635970-Amphidinium_carterae.1